MIRYKEGMIREYVTKTHLNNYIVYNKKMEPYYNIASGFDIEVSSFYNENNEKRACMYVWQFGFHNPYDHSSFILYGRTWEEFHILINEIRDVFRDGTLIIWVQNLDYEFQFLRKQFLWDNVFATKKRKIIYGKTGNITFRCSYFQSNKSLAKMGSDLNRYKAKKLIGDLDYNLIRHNKTPLTDTELGYCENDIVVLTNYIQEKIEDDGDITKIPYTNTGYVRNYCRNAFFKDPKYRSLMKKLTVTKDEYAIYKRCFQGGFTHASWLWSGEKLENITSYDMCSSYPAVMVCEKFPMSRPIQKTIKSRQQFDYLNRNFCTIFTIRFHNIKEKLIHEHLISKSKCFMIKNEIIDNGRIVSADELTITITNVDFEFYEKFYSWDSFQIIDFMYFKKQYLPRTFVSCILDFYEKKTELKDVAGKEIDYAYFKGMQNSCFGMTVEDIVRECICYTDDWCDGEKSIDEQIEAYNRSKGRFLYYPWGIFVTAYARRNLMYAIYECGKDYVYSDTDSCKFLNPDQHLEFFDWYNKQCSEKMKAACNYHGFEYDRTRPKTIKGKEKPLGIYECDGEYKNFKTLGAKRYMYDNGSIHITLAGVNKQKGAEYLNSFEDPFEHFTVDLCFPKEHAGKLCHTYIDEPIDGEVTDYLGITNYYHEESCVHMEPIEYNMSISEDYDRLLGLVTNELRWG